MRRSLLLALLVSVVPACGPPDPCKGAMNCIPVPEGSSTKTVEDAFALVVAGGSIAFGDGSFQLQKTLNLATANVTVRGQGIDLTTLDFSQQAAGEDGILVTGDGFAIQDLKVLDAKGNGIKVTGTAQKLVEGVTFQRVAGVWTAAASAQNGKYAIYPVLAKDVLMEDCVAQGSSDAGIYVGQSTNIIVRRNKAQGNVAGLEIENSVGADVYDNDVEGNSGGLLVFGLPDLIQNTSKVRVFNNTAHANNTTNFAGGGIVQEVPAGIGALIMSSSTVEFFGNTIDSNDTAGIAVVSYCVADQNYCGDPANASKVLDPFPRNIWVHDNMIMGNGTLAATHLATASGDLSQLAIVIDATFGTAVPQMLYDGLFSPPPGTDPAAWTPSDPANPMGICFTGNNATFSNFDASTFDMGTLKFPHAMDPANTDVSTFACTPSLGLGPIQIPGVMPSPM